MTDKEKQDIIDAVLLQIQNNSQSVDTLQLADSLNGVSSLPCVKGEELVSVPLSLFEKIVSDTAASSASGAIIEETNARISADANLQAQITETKDGNAELLKRIIGKSTSSSAYTDPFKYLDNFASEKDENGTVTKNAIRVMQDYLLETLRHSDYRDSFPFIGHMRAHVEGVPIEMWTYVKAWNTGSTNGVFVQVVRTNFGLKNGVISSALTEAFHEYHRTVTVGMANGSVTDVTATAWKESNADISDMANEGISKADAALSQIHEERQERAAQDRALAEAVSQERAARTAADAELLKRIIGKSTSSSAYTDPFKYLDNFASEKDENGTVTKNAIRVMQDALLDTLRHSDYSDSFPYIGHMRAHVEGVPIEVWNYVKAWNTGSTNGVFVQVVRTNFGLKNGVISSALTSEFHEYHREIIVSMADGLVTDVTATSWNESTMTVEQAKNLSIVTNLGHYSTRDNLLAAAAKINVVQLSSDNTTRILFGSYGVTNAVSVLILQHNTRTGVVGSSGSGTTVQYVFDGKERYTRYIDHNAFSVTAVQGLQPDGVRSLYFTQKGFIGLRDMWGTQVGSGFFLPDNTAIREDAANTTATSVGLIITSFLGTTKTATLGAVTSARAGLMTVALYNELQQATAGVATEAAARKAADAELQAKIQDHEDRIWKLENQWYGIEWDTEVSSPAVTRIGNMDLHRTLPIQSRMRGCLLNDNGKVVEYLNEKDWTGHDLSGARGQVMVEIPFHYRRFETDGTKRRVKMSEYPLQGFNFVKMGYLSANEATIQRSTGELASVVNLDPDFRGGNNQAELDGTYKSVLGKPVNYISLKEARTAARKRGKEGDTQWNCYTYDIHVTLTWLFVVEYANRNAQLPFTAELTAEGFHQGGLGSFSIPNADYKSYFHKLPVIPCGCTHHLGNGSGVVNLHLATDDGTYERDILVPRYRGVEVPFGHLKALTDGILGKRADKSSEWTVYVTSDPAVFGSEDTTQYRVVGLTPSAYGFIKDIHFGEQGDITTSKNSGGSSTTYFSDFYENYAGIECYPCFGGVFSQQEERNGLFYLTATANKTASSEGYGTRLCFLPAE